MTICHNSSAVVFLARIMLISEVSDASPQKN